MNKINYDAEMQNTLKNLQGKPSLFLHSCCAPCSSGCIEALVGYFDVTVVYYNPNIDTDEEYAYRLSEQKRFLSERFGETVKIVDFGHCKEDFAAIAKGRESLPEGGERCFDCYRIRMEKAAALCKEGDYFATTLTVSPLKNAAKINETGFLLASKYGVNYLPSDFKKRNGYLRSLENSKKYNLYRQNYCGCEYSKR